MARSNKNKIYTCATCAKYVQVNNMNGVDQKDQHRPYYCCRLQLLEFYLQLLAQGCSFADAKREHQIPSDRHWLKDLVERADGFSGGWKVGPVEETNASTLTLLEDELQG